MDVDGGDMTQVTTDPAPDWGPRWSPDGQEVSFFSYRTGNREVWVMPVDGGAARQLTREQDIGWQASTTAWSPDGRVLAFTRWPGGGVHLVPRDGGEPQYVGSGGYPDWSPDGTWIVTTGNPGPRLVPSSGGESEPLTESRGGRPRWSPDGTQVFFSRDKDFWTVSPVDGVARRLTELTKDRGALGQAALATDGEYLYFTWVEDLGDIWVMDVDWDEE